MVCECWTADRHSDPSAIRSAGRAIAWDTPAHVRAALTILRRYFNLSSFLSCYYILTLMFTVCSLLSVQMPLGRCLSFVFFDWAFILALPIFWYHYKFLNMKIGSKVTSSRGNMRLPRWQLFYPLRVLIVNYYVASVSVAEWTEKTIVGTHRRAWALMALHVTSNHSQISLLSKHPIINQNKPK